ncbi:hypothetical protein PIB30_113049, partial [Stylosanthes scabra]|nr:hypothetical protein [Stylosanthes scabra]
MEESIHVVFDESNSHISRKDTSDNLIASFDSLNLDGEEKEKETNEASTQETKVDKEVQIIEPSTQGKSNELPKEWRTSKDHLLENIIGDISKR